MIVLVLILITKTDGARGKPLTPSVRLTLLPDYGTIGKRGREREFLLEEGGKMSADNWTICPKCDARVNAEHHQKLQKAKDSYGVVTAAEYEQLIKQARTAVKLEATLREDCEIGVYQGQFYASYTGRCTECGWQHTFKLEEPIQI